MEPAAHRGRRHNLALAQSFNLKQAQCRMPTADAQARYPLTQGVNPWLVTLAVMLPTFMEVLDTAIASVALPYIAGSLSATHVRSDMGADQLPGGKRGDSAGLKLVCAAVWAEAVFAYLRGDFHRCVVLLRGGAVTGGDFAGALIVQGAGGGALQPLSQSILLESFPPAKRSMGMAAFALGIVVAPVLGSDTGRMADRHL